MMNLTVKQGILVALLAVHTAWIPVHLGLVHAEVINPWKLGGYGMYTRPAPYTDFEIESLAGQGSRGEELVRDANFDGMFDYSALSSFHCEALSAAHFKAFFDDNADLIGHPLAVSTTTTKFYRFPIREEVEVTGRFELQWKESNRFEISGTVCGEEYSDTGKI